jgi:hypothetical protein
MNNKSPSFCKDCKWMVVEFEGALPVCSSPNIGYEVDLVTGEHKPMMSLCSSQRNETIDTVIQRFGLCGPTASFFEAKP